MGIILSGDPKQLGPIVRSTVASRNGMSLSLQERLMGLRLYNSVEEYCVMTKLLDNYRSHQALLCIPSALFYNGSLRCKAPDTITSVCKDFEELANENFPILIHDVKGYEKSKLDTPSFYNEKECYSVLKVVKALVDSDKVNINAGQISVITCFRAQVLKMRQIFRKGKMSSVNVGLVEDFQGQENLVVIISTVLTKDQDRWKTGPKGGLGFMNDPKKYNVALTRGSALCVVVGCVDFLEQNGTYWSALLLYVKKMSGLSLSNADGDPAKEGDLDKDSGIAQFMTHVEELDLCLGVAHEDDRYEYAMRGYYVDTPEWRVCI